MIKCLLTFINRALFIISIIRTDKIDNAEKGKPILLPVFLPCL